jgi:hypothetical protein
LGQTGAQTKHQQQVGVASPEKTDSMEGMETSSGQSVIMRWRPNTTTGGNDTENTIANNYGI